MTAEALLSGAARPAGGREAPDAGAVLLDGVLWAAILGRIHRRHGLDRLLVSPAGYAACAAEDASMVTRFGLPVPDGISWVPRRLLDVAVAAHRPAEAAGLSILRVEEPTRSLRALPESDSVPGAAGDRRFRLQWAADLCTGHADLVRALLGATADHLDSRTLEGTSLLTRQVPQAVIADTAMDVAEAVERLSAVASIAQVADIHRRLVDAGRRAIRLLGARGFLSDGLGGSLYAAELTCRLYLDAEGEQ